MNLNLMLKAVSWAMGVAYAATLLTNAEVYERFHYGTGLPIVIGVVCFFLTPWLIDVTARVTTWLTGHFNNPKHIPQIDEIVFHFVAAMFIMTSIANLIIRN